MSDVEALAWNDGRLAAAESAACACGHATLDHAWHGCENCACTRSAVHALLTSDWLAAYVAAERDRAVREALAPVRALADRWDALAEISEHDRAYVLDSVADDLRAALPDDREDHA